MGVCAFDHQLCCRVELSILPIHKDSVFQAVVAVDSQDSRHRRSYQMPQAATKAPASKPSEVELPPQLRQDAPLHLREVVGSQRIARGDTVLPLSTASQPVHLMGVTFSTASGKTACTRFTNLRLLRDSL